MLGGHLVLCCRIHAKAGLRYCKELPAPAARIPPEHCAALEQGGLLPPLAVLQIWILH